MGRFFSDLFKGVNGQAWELARFSAAWAIFSYSFAFLYALIVFKKIPDWGSLGTGYGAVLLAAGAYIGLKDFAKAKAEAVTSAAVTATAAGKDNLNA